MRKKASQAGQDLRMPVMGGVKFPTDDSKSFSKGLLAKSKGSTEVGPTPSPKSLVPTGPSVASVTGTQSSVMPKIGADMSIENDPFIRYLKKEGMQLDDNADSMSTSSGATERVSHDPHDARGDHAVAQTKALLDENFDSSAHREKYMSKDRKITAVSGPGIVEKLLRRK